jgi:hypothetical protein
LPGNLRVMIKKRCYGCPGLSESVLKEEEVREKSDPSLTHLKTKKKQQPVLLRHRWHALSLSCLLEAQEEEEVLRKEAHYRAGFIAFLFQRTLCRKNKDLERFP